HPGARPERPAVHPRSRPRLRGRSVVHPLGRLRVHQADLGLRAVAAAELHAERGLLAPHLHVLARPSPSCPAASLQFSSPRSSSSPPPARVRAELAAPRCGPTRCPRSTPRPRPPPPSGWAI